MEFEQESLLWDQLESRANVNNNKKDLIKFSCFSFLS